jgi:hypothetical protein
VPAFAASSDFAIDKPSHTPCPNLGGDFGCSIHAELRERGFPGCTVYECFGAGQRVVQELYGGRDWQSAPEIRQGMFAAFEVVERLHELLWYLQDALARPAVAPLRHELEGLRDVLDAACRAPVPGDVAPFQLRADGLLGEVSGLVRAGTDGPDLRGRDLAGQDLRDRDLGPADLLGADLRAADVAGTDLSEALFLTQFQVNAARGDGATRLPGRLARPAYWRVS